jgi:hypothetical protein
MHATNDLYCGWLNIKISSSVPRWLDLHTLVTWQYDTMLSCTFSYLIHRDSPQVEITLQPSIILTNADFPMIINGTILDSGYVFFLSCVKLLLNLSCFCYVQAFKPPSY